MPTPRTRTFAGGLVLLLMVVAAELIRDGVGQPLTITPCRLRFLYQGMDPGASGDFAQLPWRLGLMTRTSTAC